MNERNSEVRSSNLIRNDRAGVDHQRPKLHPELERLVQLAAPPDHHHPACQSQNHSLISRYFQVTMTKCNKMTMKTVYGGSNFDRHTLKVSTVPSSKTNSDFSQHYFPTQPRSRRCSMERRRKNQPKKNEKSSRRDSDWPRSGKSRRRKKSRPRENEKLKKRKRNELGSRFVSTLFTELCTDLTKLTLNFYD